MKLSPLIIGNIEISPPLLLAPMAGVANLPFRIIASEYGAGFVYTELISAEALSRRNEKTEVLLKTDIREKPVGVQLFGANTETMVMAAEKVAKTGARLIDINMGCPVKKVVKSRSGAALLKDPAKIKEMLKAVVDCVNIPVTVKIRTGWDNKNINAVEIAKIAEECGVKAITVHGRTALQSFTGKADWNVIANVKSNVSIPVIGNGDVTTVQSAKEMFEVTRCDAVMLGRGTLGRPWLFRETIAFIETGEIIPHPSQTEIKAVMLEHLNLNICYFGERRGINLFKNHAAWYAKGIRGAIGFRQKVNKISSCIEMTAAIEELFESRNS